MTCFLRIAFLIPFFALSLVLAGCGDDGKDGRDGVDGLTGEQGDPGDPGEDGAPGAPGEDAFSLDFVDAHAFTGLLDAGIDSVTVVDGTFTVNFTVAGLPDANQVSAEYTIAKWVPAENSWIGMMQRSVTYNAEATTVVRASNLRPGNITGSGGTFSYTYNHNSADIDFSQGAYWTHAKPAVSADAYGTYVQGILDAIAANAAWDVNATYRLGVTSRQGERFTAVVYVDGTGQVVPNPTADNALVSCMDCHGDRGDGQTAFAAHGNRRNDPQLCSSCHNNFTYDSANSSAVVGGWTPIDAMTMIHKIHAGIEGYKVAGYDASDVRFPDWTFGRTDLPTDETPFPGNPGVANCTACHKGDVPAAGESWNVKAAGVCATCHAEGGAAVSESHTAFNLYNCTGCHGVNNFAQVPDTYHGVSEQLGALANARSYAMEIVSVDDAVAGQAAKVTWRVAKNGTYQNLFAGDDTYLEDAVRLGLGWGYGDDWTNDGSGNSSNGDAGRPLQTTANAVNTVPGADATYAVTTFPALPIAATAGRNGFAVIERGPAGINVSSALKTLTLGVGEATLGDRRDIVSTESCLSCHNTVGRHGTTADAASGVTSCVTCHNAGSLSRDTSVVQGSVDFMYIMHAIHGVGEKRESFDRRRDHGYTHVTYPNSILDCSACHIGGSEAFPVDPTERLGVFADNSGDANSPMGSICYSCHQNTGDEVENRVLKGHINANGGEMFGNAMFDEYVEGFRAESCTFCHKP